MKMCGNKKKPVDFSKKIIKDIRLLLYIVTIGGLNPAAYCFADNN